MRKWGKRFWCQFPVLSKKINSKNFPILFHKRQSTKMHSPFFAVKCEWSFAFFKIYLICKTFFYEGALNLYFIIECGSNKIVVITVGDHNKKFTLEIAIHKKERKQFQRGRNFLVSPQSFTFFFRVAKSPSSYCLPVQQQCLCSLGRQVHRTILYRSSKV